MIHVKDAREATISIKQTNKKDHMLSKKKKIWTRQVANKAPGS